jgi:Putative peptidoglycan binding domain
VRKRRNDDPRLVARAARAAGSLGFWIWAKAARRPVDSFAILGTIAASLVIIVNAVFLQSGSHPAPFFANPPPPPATGERRPKVAEPMPPAHSAAAMRAPPLPFFPPLAGEGKSKSPPPLAREDREGARRRNDAIAELIGSSSRIMAVQRALSDYGYGQIKPSGIVDEATRAAIEKFEREHKLRVTGRLSDRLVSDLAAMIGHPLE